MMTAKYAAVWAGVVAGMLPAVSAALADDALDTPAITVEAAYKQFDEVSDAMLDHAYEPPSKQEMLLRGLRGVWKRTRKTPPPSDLARRISAASSDEQFRELLRDVFGSKVISVSARDTFLESAVLREGATLTPLEQLTIERQLKDNLYVGIGIQIAKRGAYPTMPKVFPRGPARKAKALDGDKILAVDGVSTENVALGEVVGMLRGPRGADVTVRLQTGDEPPRDVLMTRDVVPIDSVEGVRRREDDSWDFALAENRQVAFLKLVELKGSTVSELRAAARRIEREGFRAVILDISQLDGGEFRHAVMLADLLLPEAKLGYQLTATGKQPLTASSNVVLEGLPLVVVIGKSTRGPAEWLAAALKDQKRARLIGFRTAGDGAIYKELDLESGHALRLRSGEMIRADGRPIQLPTLSQARTTVERREIHRQASEVGGVFPHTPTPSTLRNHIKAALTELQPHLENSLLETDS